MVTYTVPTYTDNCAPTSGTAVRVSGPTNNSTMSAGTANVVFRATDAVGAAVCHISTDFVFRGDQDRPYDEFDMPQPQGCYARSKRAGEELVLRACRRAFIVRVGGLYGRGGKNFFSTLVSRLKQGQPLRIDRQRQVSPTWVRPLARQLIALCEHGEYGMYHATCQGQTTWHDFALAACHIANELGRPLQLGFSGVDSIDLKTLAPRPAMSTPPAPRMPQSSPAARRWPSSCAAPTS
mgnify:CR=1 FL=1